MFEGVRGASYKGDISVDDIELKNGSCASSGKNVRNVRCIERGYNNIITVCVCRVVIKVCHSLVALIFKLSTI